MNGKIFFASINEPIRG